MLGENDFRFVTPEIQRLINVFRPGQRLADFRPTQRIGVVQRVGNIFGGFDQFFLFDISQHF